LLEGGTNHFILKSNRPKYVAIDMDRESHNLDLIIRPLYTSDPSISKFIGSNEGN
jgi:hypothetical protein